MYPDFKPTGLNQFGRWSLEGIRYPTGSGILGIFLVA